MEFTKKKVAGIGIIIALATGAALSGLNVQFKIILPSGLIMEDVILSSGNYSQMQNNVGVFTVKNKVFTYDPPTTGYCPLAKIIWDGHIGYYDKIANDFKSRMLPKWCDIEIGNRVGLTESLGISENNEIKYIPIPEFEYRGIILSLAILAVVIISVLVLRKYSKTWS
jgi:hypothetical protein